MGCTNCSNSGGVPRGCKNNGTCSSGGCDKLGVFNWLSNMAIPPGKQMFDVVELRFKNSRKGFYRYNDVQSLQVGDAVVVEASPGYDIGIVSIVGDLARIQLSKKAPDLKWHEAKNILRKATQTDLDVWKEARSLEFETMHNARKHANANRLDMKISDVEYQADKTKATFYYTAETRIDFRELIRLMANDFKVKIEMRQIGARQESSRLGGIGSCGRELCCSTWLTDFRSVSTSAARYQQLSLNPQKMAGQCGKLKCCLNYELDMYMEALKEFPSTDIKLQTEKGRGIHIKTDVFKEEMWYLFQPNEREGGMTAMIALSPKRVKEIIAMNKAGEKPIDLKDFEETKPIIKQDYTNVVGQDSLDRFDDVFKKKTNKRKRGSSNNSSLNRVGGRPQNQNASGKIQNEGTATQNKSNNSNRNRNNKRTVNPNTKQPDNAVNGNDTNTNTANLKKTVNTDTNKNNPDSGQTKTGEGIVNRKSNPNQQNQNKNIDNKTSRENE